MSSLVTIPDLINPVVGFRAWSSQGDGLLHSRGGGWIPGPNQAICDAHATHDPPVEGCHCGLYAYHGLDRFSTNGTYGDVFGTVVAWGDICVARDGFRAQYAQVVMIASPLGGRDHLAQLDEIAENYQCEHVQLHDLEARAHEFGELVPGDMRPGGARGPYFPTNSSPIQYVQQATSAGISVTPGGAQPILIHPNPSTKPAPPIGVPISPPVVFTDTPTMNYVDGVPCVQDDRSIGLGLGFLTLAGVFGMPGVAQLIGGQSGGLVPTLVGGAFGLCSWLVLR